MTSMPVLPTLIKIIGKPEDKKRNNKSEQYCPNNRHFKLRFSAVLINTMIVVIAPAPSGEALLWGISIYFLSALHLLIPRM